MSLAACGGDDGGGEMIVPMGEHHHYVANQAFVPATNTQARDYGLDIGSPDGDGPDGTKDNQLGMVLSTLAGMGFDIQATIDKAVAEGSIILLVDVQTPDLANTTNAGIQVFLGDNEMPAACNPGESYDEMAGTGCGHHLDGSGMFSIAANSPQNAALGGTIVGGKLKAGPGNLSLQIALGGTEAIQLDLIGARAEATGITATDIGGVVFGGAVTKEDIDTKVIPAIHSQIVPIIAEDCPGTDPNSNPPCDCTADSTGKTILGLFDTEKDCMVTVDEIKSNSLIVSLLAPDVEIDGKMALSIGIKATAVSATYTAPGQ
jgi:hypothetical protein